MGGRNSVKVLAAGIWRLAWRTQAEGGLESPYSPQGKNDGRGGQKMWRKIQRQFWRRFGANFGVDASFFDRHATEELYTLQDARELTC